MLSITIRTVQSLSIARKTISFYIIYLPSNLISVTQQWSFFEAGHGKSVADGIGGNIKRMLKVCHGFDIKNVRDAYEAIKQSETRKQVHLIEEADRQTDRHFILDDQTGELREIDEIGRAHV